MKAPRSAALPDPAPVAADAQSAHVLSGRYRLGAKIGSGGMADVHEGVDTRLRRSVAVKFFRPGADPRNEERLTAEAVLLARLQHPGLVTVYDAGRHDDRAYLVMQLIDGPTLRSLLTRGTLSQRRVADLGTTLARALAHVHRAGIVHRDVKPSNVLLDSAGVPHLADFGIARLADATRHTSPDVLTGTAAYLAPEQVEGRHVGSATDVYALGLVLLECLKGELEYQGTPLEAAVARLHRPPSVPDWVDPDLADLIRAMTAREPGARPDAEQCAKALSLLGAGNDPYLPPRSAPVGGGLPAARAARPETDEPMRTDGLAVTRPGRPDGVRHNRRLAVGTALAAFSVALGTTLTVTLGAVGSGDDRAAATSTTAPPPAGTAVPERGPGAAPPTGSRSARPGSRSPDASGPAAAATGSRTEPVSMNLGSSNLSSSDRATQTRQAPARHHRADPRKPTPHHSRGTDGHTRRTPHRDPKPPAQTTKPERQPAPQDDD
ncbi:protein kinase [Streptomyces sp. NPDC051133]|uniref:serine/threonine-protein kinase n=1 Tax=Streptomyces sp. NPDC051133 TaxID=3155521 RepID=UPI00344477B1